MRRVLLRPLVLASLFAYGMIDLLYAQSGPHSLGTRPDGSAVYQLAQPGRKALVVVLYFVASDCPISNRTFPEMKRVREEYERRGAAFWYVYPNAGERVAEVLMHQQAYDPGGPAILDTHGELARMAAAQVTPEVSVLLPSQSAPSWKPAYTGRVDDRYVHIGLERPRASEHFAERAIAAGLTGRSIEHATGTPVGCAIVSPAR